MTQSSEPIPDDAQAAGKRCVLCMQTIFLQGLRYTNVMHIYFSHILSCEHISYCAGPGGADAQESGERLYMLYVCMFCCINKCMCE